MRCVLKFSGKFVNGVSGKGYKLQVVYVGLFSGFVRNFVHILGDCIWIIHVLILVYSGRFLLQSSARLEW